eukprot:343785_1
MDSFTTFSGTSSPRSPASSISTFERIEKRISLDNLLKEAHLDRDALLDIIKQNDIALHDLDESKIQSIIQQATKTQHNTKATHSNPFALSIDTRHEETNTNDMSSHYCIIKHECIALRQSMKRLQLKMKSEYHLSNMKQK